MIAANFKLNVTPAGLALLPSMALGQFLEYLIILSGFLRASKTSVRLRLASSAGQLPAFVVNYGAVVMAVRRQCGVSEGVMREWY